MQVSVNENVILADSSTIEMSLLSVQTCLKTQSVMKLYYY